MRIILICYLLAIVFPCQSEGLNIVPFGSLRLYSATASPLGRECDLEDFNHTASVDRCSDLGVFWWQARDIHSVAVVYHHAISQEFAKATQIQYWHSTWPETPPEMPAKEDLEDDPWRGEWLTASTKIDIDGSKVTFTFRPLRVDENKNALFLPGSVLYRRTLKIRLKFPARPPTIKELFVYSMTFVKKESIRIEMNCSARDTSTVAGGLEIFNGLLNKVSGWNWNKTDRLKSDSSWLIHLDGKIKGVIANVTVAEELLPGSNEETIITVRTSKNTFSFSASDLKSGPISIPAYNVYISRVVDKGYADAADLNHGETIRQKITSETEQNYERARKEIPELDPTQRDPRHSLKYMYLPLAVDANWQKFAIIWGGNILIDKRRTRAQGQEYTRCNWRGEELRWEIGTGKTPSFNRTKDNCQLATLHNFLPVVINRWNDDGLIFEEEAFATLLYGPLSPFDPQRDEQTPAVLMMKLVISNPSSAAKQAHLWLAGNKALFNIFADNSFILDSVNTQSYLRCHFKSPAIAEKKILSLTPDDDKKNVFYQIIPITPNSAQTVYFYFPFVGDLTSDYQSAIQSLSYEKEKERAVSYWRDLVQQFCVFNVPETKFNDIAKAVIPHIRMSVTKDPKSGLFMVPAGTLGYLVYANEACFQTILLDRLGDHRTVSEYLKTFMALQGSVPLAGDFTGDQKDVFYGVKVDSVYNLTAAPYNLDHGTVLWALARHYLYLQEREWLVQAAPHMKRAANWIIEQRQNTKVSERRGNAVTHYGLLPAGRLEDAAEWQYWYAVNAYAYMGLEATAKVFEMADISEADYYRTQARAYLSDIRRSIQKATELAPVVRLRNQQYVPYVPSQAHLRLRSFGPKKTRYYDRYQRQIYPTLRQSATREVLYGPMILLKSGIIDPMDPIAEWILDDWEDNLTLSSSLHLNVHGWVDDEYWFSRGGIVFQPNLQNPVEVYLKRHEIPAALRSLYNGFVACLYPDANVLAEEFRYWSHASGHYYKVPDEARFVNQVLDLLILETRDELWLASGTPRRWLEPGQKIELLEASSQYGKVSYVLRLGKKFKNVEAVIELKLANHPDKILLFVRTPFSDPIHAVEINGKEWSEWDGKREVIFLPIESGIYKINIAYM